MTNIYYKTTKESETGKKINSLMQRVKDSETAARKLERKYNAEASYHKGETIAGCVGFKFSEIPDLNVWKKLSKTENGFTPKRSTKEGRKIQEEMDNVPEIHRDEVEKCVGFKDVFCSVGFRPGKEAYGFVLDSDWKFEMPKDCEEITYTEFQKIK